MRDATMPSGPGERYDFFLSRRGSVAAIAQEVTDVLKENGYEVVVQDYDIQIGESWVLAIHDCIKSSRDLIILFTSDYEKSQYTREEFAAFWKKQADEPDKHRIIVLRCEDVQPDGLLSHNVFQDLVGVNDAEERKRRIIAAAKRRSAAPPLPPRPFIGVPPRIASFTGRADELDRLDTTLIQDRPAAVTQATGRAAVRGMGGVGKTSLAVEYAHRFRGLYAGVCWCPSETRTGLLSALAILAATLGAATAEEADVEKAAKAALRRLAEQRATWLLVYDNVTAPDHIADFLPSAGARVLITSRFSDWGEVADEVALDVLPLEQAVVLLQRRTARSDAAGARMLAEALGCLPLALDHAAASCRRSQMRFADYAEKASSIIRTLPRGAGYPRSVAATFDLAITEVDAQCPATEALMAYLAQCAPERIPMTLVEGAVENEAERLEAVAALAEVSLLKHDPFEDGTPAVTVHRLVQAVALARSEAKGSVQVARGLFIARLAAIYPEDERSQDPKFWPLCSQLTPHLLALREARSDAVLDVTEWANLLDRAATYLDSRAAFSQLNTLVRHVLATCERALGPEHPLTAENLNNLAITLHSQGDYAAARPLYERALAVREKVFGPEHPYTATNLNNLANLLRDTGHAAEAEPLFRRGIVIGEMTLGPEHPDVATRLSNLAVLLGKIGRTSEAEPLFHRAIAIGEKTLGLGHPLTQRYRSHFARLLVGTQRASEALALGEAALATHQAASGSSHPWTKDSARVTADALDALGRGDGAKALRVKYGITEPESPKTP
jgi:tetratricopeptide (TPR) repeat protein